MEVTTQNPPLGAQIYPYPNSSQSDTFDHHPAPPQPRDRRKSDLSTRPPPWNLTLLDSSPPVNRTNANLRDTRRHSRSKSKSTDPPTPHLDSTSDPNAGGDQFLHPTQTIPHTDLGHRRSRSSGLGDRGTGELPSAPYPSPVGSPSLRHEPLPLIPSLQNLSLSSDVGRDRSISVVVSERRRKVDKNLACPVPGCGRTFDRDPSLRGGLSRPSHEKALTSHYRAPAFTQRGETIPVQVAWVRENVRKGSRLQAPRAASFQLPPISVKIAGSHSRG